MRILISTGIYPPEIGGPAKYAENLYKTWKKEGHQVTLKVFSNFNAYPTGIRHLLYFFSILRSVSRADYILILDTFSAALPTVIASLILNKKTVLRTGGDFLWELYMERTGDTVLLRDFYKTRINNFSIKEKVIFYLVGFVLRNVGTIVWSTEWQKNIFMSPYDLVVQNHKIIENFYGPKEENSPQSFLIKTFMASARDLRWKNLDLLREIFSGPNSKIPKDVELITTGYEFESFVKKIKESYAFILVSLGDISPNAILDAIRCNKPFICTKEVGIYERIKEVGIFVDPLNKNEIEAAVLKLLDQNAYLEACEKVRKFSFTHTWDEIGSEFIEVFKSIK